MRRGVQITFLAAVIGLAGCAAQRSHRASIVRRPIPADYKRMAVQRPASLLLGGEGVDGLALNLGRDEWPSAYRDTPGGESAVYRVTFNDLQGSPWGGGFLFGNGSVWRQFRSVQTGSVSR